MATQAYNEQKSPAELEREIEQTRHNIDGTLDELGERFQPGQLLDEGMKYLRSSGAGSGTKDFFVNLGRTVRDNPVPLVATVASVAWLMSANEGKSHTSSRGEVDVAGGLSSAKEQAGETLSATGQQLSDGGRRLQEGAAHKRAQIEGQFQKMLNEHPLVLGLAGAALGALLGGSLPSTQKEDELMGDASDSVATSAAQMTREQMETVRDQVETEHQSVEEQYGNDGIDASPDPKKLHGHA